MSEPPRAPEPPDGLGLPQAVAAPKRRWLPSLVWVVPIVAAVVGVWIATQAIVAKGPTITISFKTAEGLEAGKTKLRYKNVDVGTVRHIAVSRDLSGVIVTAEMAKQAEAFLVDDTQFWVVRPRVSGGSVSGLSTLLSGAYIGVAAGKSQEERRDFVGLEVTPVVIAGLAGRQFELRGDEIGSLDVGSPVYFRRIQVGQVVAFQLDKDGRSVIVKVFVNAPYDQYVTTSTRFWHASGFDITLDASGLRVDTQSLASIIAGGIAFQAPTDLPVAPPAEANTLFALSADRVTAMKQPDREVQTYLVYFNESLRGLAPGAPVDFRGIVVGEVKSLGLEYDRESTLFRFPVEINIYPERMRSRYRPGAQQVRPDERVGHALLDRLVARGFRAQLKSANLFTGQLFIAFDFFPEAPKAKMNWSKTPPELPTVSGGGLDELEATLTHIAKKLDKLPLETLAAELEKSLNSLNIALQSADKLVNRLDTEVAPEVRKTLEDTRKALGDARATLSADAPLQQDLRDALRELSRAAQSLRTLTDYLERHPEALIRGKKEDEK